MVVVVVLARVVAVVVVVVVVIVVVAVIAVVLLAMVVVYRKVFRSSQLGCVVLETQQSSLCLSHTVAHSFNRP